MRKSERESGDLFFPDSLFLIECRISIKHNTYNALVPENQGNGELEDNAYPGVFNPQSGKHTLTCAMEAQLHSTRLFNENYFALIQTIVLDSVPRFNELFPLYEMEHAWLSRTGSSGIWNSDVLLAESYRDLTQWHLKELVRLRFLPADWPEDLKEFLLNSTGKDLLIHGFPDWSGCRLANPG